MYLANLTLMYEVVGILLEYDPIVILLKYLVGEGFVTLLETAHPFMYFY